MVVLVRLSSIATELDINSEMSVILGWIKKMATTAQNVGIKNSWSLMAFAKAHGRMKTGMFSAVDKETGEVRNFKSAVFVSPEDGKTVNCFVGFSSKLGELSDAEIVSRKDELQVVELETGSYKLCAQGDNAWADINLGI